MPDIIEVTLFKKGLMLLRLGKYQEAIQAFNDFMIKVPQSPYIQKAEQYIEEAEFRIAEKKFKEKNWEEAVKLLTQFAIRYPQNPFTPKAIKLAGQALVNIVEDKITRKDCAGILFFWDNYKNFFPKKEKKGLPLFHVSQCLMVKNRKQEAVKLLEWIETNVGVDFPKRKELFSYLAHYYYDTDQYQKAEKTAKTLVGLSSAKETPDVHQLLVQLYFLKENYPEMLKIIQKMEKEGAPEKYSILNSFYVGLYLIDTGKKKEGQNRLDSFIKSRKAMANYLDRYKYSVILLGRMYFNEGRKDKAFKKYLFFANAFTSDNNYTPESLFMLGWIKPEVRPIFWNMCLNRFPKSHWAREIKAFNLAGEIKDEARKAIGNRSH